jgi:predicted secreted protein
MAKLHGKEAFIYNNGVKIVSLQDLTLSVQNKKVDSTDHDDLQWESCIGGKVSWTVTATHVKVVGDATQDAIFDGIVAGSLLPITINPVVGSGKPQYSGNVIIDKWDWKAPNQAIQDLSHSFTGSGPLTRGVQP